MAGIPGFAKISPGDKERFRWVPSVSSTQSQWLQAHNYSIPEATNGGCAVHQQPSPEHTLWPLNQKGPSHRSLLDELLGIPQNPVQTLPILGIPGKSTPLLAPNTSTPEGRPAKTPPSPTPKQGGPLRTSQHGSQHGFSYSYLGVPGPHTSVAS